MQYISKLNIFKIFLFCLIAFSAVSCKSHYTTLTIATPVPSKGELPREIQSITLMNRSLNNQFLQHIEDSLQLHFYRNGYQLSTVVLDSAASDTTILALAELLFESGRYDVVVPLERNIERDLAYHLIPDTLSSQLVNQLCQQYNTDALMVLEQFSTKVMTDYSEDVHVDRYSGTTFSYYASLDLKYDAFFRIYKPGQITRYIQLSDTIYWESSENNQLRLFGKLPSIKQALVGAGIKIALDVDGKISPKWMSGKLGYFLFDLKDDPGQQLINENELEQATAFWMEKAQSSKKKIRSRGEYNMAVASELEGDLDRAIEWALKSFYTQYDYRTEVYLKKLEKLKAKQLSK